MKAISRRGALVASIFVVSAGGPLLLWQLWSAERTAPGAAATPGVPEAHAEPAEQLYSCGMHPQVVQRGPGQCPICGMDLTPLKGRTSTASHGEPSDEADAERAVSVDPVMVQSMGVRLAPVRRGSLSRAVRTIGEVVVAEDLVSVVNLRFSGWIEKLYVNQTGVRVRRGQRLFRVYSPELVSAQEEYLLALRTGGKDSALARSARRRLALWDLSEATIARIERRATAQRTIIISAPRAGFVLHKSVVQGARVLAGHDLFRIGKLSAIWVHARVYEFDAPWIAVGQRATMELSFQRGKLYEGKVSYIYPTLDDKTRTLTVRLEFVNPQLRLKPGMFTTVRIDTRRKSDVLLVPTEAIIHSGERQLVFVAAANAPSAPEMVGKYEPRKIVTGLSGDGHVTEVISGLTNGEQVVVSGQFLLDSESQLQEAVQKLMAARLQVPQAPPASQPHADHNQPHGPGSATGWTCPMHPQISAEELGSCPICGMDLVNEARR